MSKRAVVGLLLFLIGAAAIVGGAFLLTADPPREGAGLALVFGGVVVEFVALFVATKSLRVKGVQGNGGNVPSGLSNFLS